MGKQIHDFQWFGSVKRWLIGRKLRKAYQNHTAEELDAFFTYGITSENPNGLALYKKLSSARKAKNA